jgi:cytochrome P450
LKEWLQDEDIKPNELLAMMIDILGAGVDTTALAVLNTMLFLATNPSKQEKAYREVQEALSKKKLSQLFVFRGFPYVYACIKEAHRMQPVFDTVGRIASEDKFSVKGYEIPKGAWVLMSQSEIGQDPRFINDPEVYQPERWIKGQSPSGEPDTYVSVPFGIGKRVCLGRFVADSECIILLAKILLRFEMIYKEELPKYNGVILLQPDKKININFIERSPVN